MGLSRTQQLSRLKDHHRVSILDACRKKLAAMARRGEFDGNPKDWRAATDILQLAYTPGTSASLKFLCLKTLCDLTEIPESVHAKIESGVGDTNITIVVPGWATQNKGADVEVTATRPDNIASHALIESQVANDSDD